MRTLCFTPPLKHPAAHKKTSSRIHGCPQKLQLENHMEIICNVS